MERILDILLGCTQKLDQQDSMAMTVLARAARIHQWSTVLTLLNRGANPDLHDIEGMNPLLWALRSPRRIQHMRYITVTGDSRFWLGTATIFYQRGPENEIILGNAHAVADYLDLALEQLISKTMNLEQQDFTGRTALSLAVENGYPPAVHLLLGQGAKVNSRDNSGISPLMWACQLPRFLELSINDLTIRQKATVLCGTVLITIPSPGGASTRVDGHSNLARRLEIIRTLIPQSLDINMRDYEGTIAIEHTNIPEVEAVLKQFGAVAMSHNVRHVASALELEPTEDEAMGILDDEPTIAKNYNTPVVSQGNKNGSKACYMSIVSSKALVSLDAATSTSDAVLTGTKSFFGSARANLRSYVKVPDPSTTEFKNGITICDIYALRKSLELPSVNLSDITVTNEATFAGILNVILEITDRTINSQAFSAFEREISNQDVYVDEGGAYISSKFDKWNFGELPEALLML